MRIAPYAALFAAAALWGANPALGRLIGPFVPPLTLSWLRWLLVLCGLAPFVWRERRQMAAALREHGGILVALALLANVPQSALVYKGLETTTAVNVGLLNSSIPVLILVLGALFFGRRMAPREAVGVALSLAGVAVVLFQGSLERARALSLNTGDLFAFGAMLTWALYTLLLPRRPALSLPAFVACMSGLGVALCAPLVAAEIALDRAPVLDAATMAGVALIALGPTLAGTLAYSYGAERTDPLRAGVFIHFMPVFASVYAIVFLDERLQGHHLAGFALILSGALIALGLLSSPPRRTLKTGSTHG